MRKTPIVTKILHQEELLSHYPYVVKILYQNHLSKWCQENLADGSYYSGYTQHGFVRQEDAVLFRLTWG